MAIYLKTFNLGTVLSYQYQNLRRWHSKRIILCHFHLQNLLFNSSYNTFQLKNGKMSFHSSYIYHKRRKTTEEKKATKIIQYVPKSKGEVVDIWQGITLLQLAKVLEKDIDHIKELFGNVYQNPNTQINDMKQLQNALRRGGRRIKFIAKPSNGTYEYEDEVKVLKPRPPPTKEDLKPRPPVVTVMGHVDHGKTTLLDALRHSSIVDKEFGGITQHIGAFLVTLDSGAKITFLDTPGHAAFTSMRARGANLTDIVVLVVAADDGVMEQTIESIKMAKNARVPMLVAINKIDSPKADIERTQRMLVEVGIQVECLGGDVQAVPISALKKQNLNQLTEALVLQADLLEIGGDPTGPVEAVIIESNTHPGRGNVTTLVVQRGTLKKGDILVAGTAMAKVRSIKDADGRILDQVSPGYPAEIDGWKVLPAAGDVVLEAKSEKDARIVIKFREDDLEQKKLEEDLKIIKQKQEMHDNKYQQYLKEKRQLGKFKMRRQGPRQKEIAEEDGSPFINVIVKTDVVGTLEAILETLDTYKSDVCPLDIVNYGVGPLTPTDIELAKAFKCVVYAFNTPVPDSLKSMVVQDGIDIREHNVIYRLIEDFKKEVNTRLPKKEIEEILGEAEVLQQFEISKGRKLLPVAGCRCVTGLLKRDALFRVMRERNIVYEGPLASMRHLKSEVDVIKADTECGLQLVDHDIIFLKGDKILCLEKKMVNQETDWDPGF
ncbi:translation initiation factor IF-2, mitochondrial [Euwallacea similis]|uniref:translation initiation factor IF-2, mitochondrial n=1 Tax=Euwallacea similis TaxID=1736056 RepID=UPI00344B99CC